jgi:predicted component of type VI protein secretion system
VGQLISTHVIPRPADQVQSMLEAPGAVLDGPVPDDTVPDDTVPVDAVPDSTIPDSTVPDDVPEPAPQPDPAPEQVTLAQLEAMPVEQLRALARQTEGLGMSKPQIRAGRKTELVERLAQIYRAK